MCTLKIKIYAAYGNVPLLIQFSQSLMLILANHPSLSLVLRKAGVCIFDSLHRILHASLVFIWRCKRWRGFDVCFSFPSKSLGRVSVDAFDKSVIVSMVTACLATLLCAELISVLCTEGSSWGVFEV